MEFKYKLITIWVLNEVYSLFLTSIQFSMQINDDEIIFF